MAGAFSSFGIVCFPVSWNLHRRGNSSLLCIAAGCVYGNGICIFRARIRVALKTGKKEFGRMEPENKRCIANAVGVVHICFTWMGNCLAQFHIHCPK